MNKYYLDNITVYQSDIIEALAEIKDCSVDLIFADPPYNIGKQYGTIKDSLNHDEYLDFSYKWLGLAISKLKPNGSMYVMTSTQNMSYFDIHIRKHLTILSRIVWHYDSSGVQAKKYFGSMYEPILYAVKDKNNYIFNSDDILVEAKTGSKRKLIDYRKNPPQPYNTHKVPGNVWYYPRVRYKMPEYVKHPTQKPESLLERIILASSNENDIVLDLFSGTFTTAKVAQKYNRKSINVEINTDYVEAGIKRLET